MLHSRFACNGQDFGYVIASQCPRIVYSERTETSATRLDRDKDLIDCWSCQSGDAAIEASEWHWEAA